jgi:Trk K+ transport system NAD-binding subunit
MDVQYWAPPTRSLMVQLFTPPDSWVGRNLRDLSSRSGYNVSVLAVKRRSLLGAMDNVMPDPERQLEESDRLIIVGETSSLERLLTETNTRAFKRLGDGDSSR